MKIVGYRLLEKTEIVKEGDVLGSSKKVPIQVALWEGAEVGSVNQPVYRPMSSFKDFEKK